MATFVRRQVEVVGRGEAVMEGRAAKSRNGANGSSRIVKEEEYQDERRKTGNQGCYTMEETPRIEKRVFT